MSSRNSKYDCKALFGWAMYDFANSAFTTLVVTFIYATYFTQAIAPDEITGTILWSRAITLCGLTVALASPFLGAMADQGGHRKRYLLFFTLTAVICTAMLYRILPGQVLPALIWFSIGNIAFELGCVFYNAFLPDIAPPDKIGSTSGLGWGVGYIGGLIAMFLAMISMVNPETPWFGLSRELGENIRATNLLVAGWFALFSLPLFLLVKEKRLAQPIPFSPAAVTDHGICRPGLANLPAGKRLQGAGDARHRPVMCTGVHEQADNTADSVPCDRLPAAVFQRLGDTFKQIGRYRQIFRFLLARLIYNDGLITIFAFGGIYAAGTFGFSFKEIMLFGIVLNITAGLGAFAFGYCDDRLGGRTTILISIVGLIIASLLALAATEKIWLWLAGILIGIFSGPNQSASRSLLARMTPPAMENEFFGFFAFSGKFTAFLGPFILGILTEVFGSQRLGMSTVLLMFIGGGLLLLRVDEREGLAVSGRYDKA